MLVALVGGLASLAWAQGPAEAAFPGKNGKIAFSAYEDGPGDEHVIFSVNPDGSDRTRLTDRSGPNYDGGGGYEPDWSPDGTRLVFANSDDDWSDPSGYIHVMGADGSGQSRIAFSPRPYFDLDYGPDWSPDGRKIAFSGWDDDDGLCKTEYEGVKWTKIRLVARMATRKSSCRARTAPTGSRSPTTGIWSAKATPLGRRTGPRSPS